MPKITYIDYTGTSRCVDAEDGMSLMEIAVNNNVPGIDGGLRRGVRMRDMPCARRCRLVGQTAAQQRPRGVNAGIL